MLSASHHGSYHKHSDDLALTLYSGGWIITDSGPYGYDYAHPMSKHAYSAAAHSTLFFPTESSAHSPGLVGILNWSCVDGLTVVRAENRRYRDVVHHREVVFDPDKRLVSVRDRITGKVPSKMFLLWQLSPELRAIQNGAEIHLIRNGKNKAARMFFGGDVRSDQVSIVRGGAGGGESVSAYAFPDFGRQIESSVIVIDGTNETLNWAVETTFLLPAKGSDGKALNYDVADGPWPIQYLLDERLASRRLIVIFPALTAKHRFAIDYKKAMAGIDANHLFVVDDFGSQGSYLICSNKNFELADAVYTLIEEVRSRLGVSVEKVVLVGCSKGGASALYFAERLGYGSVIVGAPQTRIGFSLFRQDIKNGSEIAKCMFGNGSVEA